MLRYKTKTRPGLVALYDIRPGNGAGPFLQPRSPHGAPGGGLRHMSQIYTIQCQWYQCRYSHCHQYAVIIVYNSKVFKDNAISQCTDGKKRLHASIPVDWNN